MSTQYNAIRAPYDELRKGYLSMIERENVREAIAPYIQGAKVLELACGSGFYTTYLVRWGASRVLAADISSVMLEEAQRAVDSAGFGPQVTLLEADCGKPKEYGGGPFQVVVGGWILNYAADINALTESFRNIAINLEDGGIFIGVTPPPTNDPVAFYAAENRVRPSPRGSGLLVSHSTGAVEDGVLVHRHADTPVGVVDFDTYHLRRDVYERAARAAGMRGKFEWNPTKVPDSFLENPTGGASREELETYGTVPHYGILVISKD